MVPKGAGKTTASVRLLRGALQVTTFVNADAIAKGLSGLNPDEANFEAGRIVLERVDQLAERGVDFAFETTLASRNFAARIKQWKPRGYQFHLIYLWLPSADDAIRRVADRVRRGGHHVPDKDVRNRYRSGIANFFRLYRTLADTWQFLDNSGPTGARPIAHGVIGAETVVDEAAWQQIQSRV